MCRFPERFRGINRPGNGRPGLPTGFNHSTDRGAMSRTRTFIAATGRGSSDDRHVDRGRQRISQRGAPPSGGPDPWAVPSRSPATSGWPALCRQPRPSVQVWLRPQVAAAQSSAAAVSTPGSASFHQYLSPKAYAARFGAPAAGGQGRVVAARRRASPAQGQPAALLRPGHRRGVRYRCGVPHHAQALPRHGGGERRAVPAARQQHPGLRPGLAVREGTRRDRPGQRRALLPL